MGRLRIVAGKLRGRRVAVPAGDSVRPTADRVREALFSILGERVRGARVLDLFAGSGALGLEALSRGASRVVWIESDRTVARVLRHNVGELAEATDDTLVVVADGIGAVRGGALGGRFDLVLADPPYRSVDVGRVLAAVGEAGAIVPGGRVVVEGEAGDPVVRPLPAPWTHLRRAVYGRVALDFFHFPDSID